MSQIYYQASDGSFKAWVDPTTGAPPVNQALAAGEDLTIGVTKVEQRFTYNHISTAVTTVVKAASGFLKSITINTTAAGSVTIYDNTAASGTVVAILPASAVVGTYEYNIVMNTGITIVTAAASDITVSYR